MAEAAKTREGPVDLRSAKQVSEANGARREDRLGKAAASPNSQNLTERGITCLGYKQLKIQRGCSGPQKYDRRRTPSLQVLSRSPAGP